MLNYTCLSTLDRNAFLLIICPVGYLCLASLVTCNTKCWRLLFMNYVHMLVLVVNWLRVCLIVWNLALCWTTHFVYRNTHSLIAHLVSWIFCWFWQHYIKLMNQLAHNIGSLGGGVVQLIGLFMMAWPFSLFGTIFYEISWPISQTCKA